jgi:hypothetical protein
MMSATIRKLDYSKRESDRAAVVIHEIRGLMTRPSGHGQFPFLVWDVSESGMGLWITQKVLPNEVVKITIGQPYLMVFEGVVKWVEKDIRDSGFRCGIAINEESHRLKTLYAQFCEP